MKKVLCLSLMTSFLCANANETFCENNRWNLPEIQLFTGGEQCRERVITCQYEGTRSEGWYSYPKEGQILLRKENCASTQRKPECIDLENGHEAWLIDENILPTTQCSDRDVVCSYKGTSKEGWYAYPSNERRLVAYSSCSQFQE